MAEKNFIIEGIEPAVLVSADNQVLDTLRRHFPLLRIVDRGEEIRLIGSDSDILIFQETLGLITAHYQKYQRLTPHELKAILADPITTRLNLQEDDSDAILHGATGKPIKAQTANQQKLVEACRMSDLLFATGPAGTGKTYTAIALAVAAFKNKIVKKIILTRPAVEAGEKLGFLPGDMKEKLDPYLQPLYDALNDMIPPRRLTELIEAGTIQIAPLAYMRGRTLDNAFVILDEAQNATFAQLKMFLTRMGRNAKFILTGDISQIDLPNRYQSGLADTIKLLAPIQGIAAIDFDKGDIVRHPLVKHIVEAYDKNTENS